MQRLVFLLASAAPGALGLLFQSHKVSSQWDTWAICENGTYHAFFLANVSANFTRFFDGCDGAVLVSHQAFHHPNHFLAPYKAAEVDADGALRLKWWPGNDALAGARVDRWENAPLDLAVGVVLGGRVDLRGARAPANASGAYAACLPGFEFALTDGSSLVVLVDGCAEFNQWNGRVQQNFKPLYLKSKSIRLIFGRIDCSRRVLEAQ